MRLKKDYVSYQTKEDETLLMATGKEVKSFSGLIRANEAASFIASCLMQETSEEEILEKLQAEYNAPKETLAADLKEILDTLRSVGALDE